MQSSDQTYLLYLSKAMFCIALLWTETQNRGEAVIKCWKAPGLGFAVSAEGQLRRQ